MYSRGGHEGVPEPSTPCAGAAMGPPRRQVVWAPLAPLRLIFWLRESSGKIGTLTLIPEFFLKVKFLHKNETPGQFC